MDDLAVATALAQRAVSVPGPAEYAAVRNAYAVPQDSIGATPAVLVLPGADSIETGGQTRRTTVTYTVRLYLEPVGDIARRSKTLYAYRTWLRELYDGAVTLSGNVDQAGVVGTALGTDEVAGVDYMTVEATVECVKQEAVGFTA